MDEYIELLLAERHHESDRTPCGRCGCPVLHLAAHHDFHQQVDSLSRQFELQETQ